MMNSQKLIAAGSKTYVGLSILSLAYVSLLSIYSPQATMNLVATALPNTDAISSIRGIYGGVGLVITISLIYLLVKDLRKALIFLCMFWFAYALSRLLTLWVDGPLGAFGNQWLITESVLGLLALLCIVFYKQKG
jgi:uncharacterized membrane protein